MNNGYIVVLCVLMLIIGGIVGSIDKVKLYHFKNNTPFIIHDSIVLYCEPLNIEYESK